MKIFRAFTGAVEQSGVLDQKYLDENWDGTDTGWGALSVFPLFNVLCNLVGIGLRDTCGRMDFGFCDGLPDDGLGFRNHNYNLNFVISL